MRPWLIGATGLGILLVALSIDTDSTRTRRVGHFTFVERIHVTRHPYTHIAESGGDAYLPIPLRSETVRWQGLVVDDDTLWSVGRDHWVEPSPSGAAVVVGSHSHDEPWRIVYTDGRVVEVPSPPAESLLPHEGHDYPFDYSTWANSGRDLLLLAHTHGWREVDYFPRHRASDPVVNMTTYVRTWSIDPRTGASQVMGHCEMPFTDTPDWSGYGNGCAQVKKHR
jgi:hypothetical protein